jgi:hypothetical protein
MGSTRAQLPAAVGWLVTHSGEGRGHGKGFCRVCVPRRRLGFGMCVAPELSVAAHSMLLRPPRQQQQVRKRARFRKGTTCCDPAVVLNITAGSITTGRQGSHGAAALYMSPDQLILKAGNSCFGVYSWSGHRPPSSRLFTHVRSVRRADAWQPETQLRLRKAEPSRRSCRSRVLRRLAPSLCCSPPHPPVGANGPEVSVCASCPAGAAARRRHALGTHVVSLHQVLQHVAVCAVRACPCGLQVQRLRTIPPAPPFVLLSPCERTSGAENIKPACSLDYFL